MDVSPHGRPSAAHVDHMSITCQSHVNQVYTTKNGMLTFLHSELDGGRFMI